VIRQTTLPSGVRVLTESMPQLRSATIGIWADVGSASERPAQRGISHMVEHMLFKGTPRRTARAIAEAMDSVGGNMNAFTDKETTCYYATVIDRHVGLAIDVLGDMFVNSLFDPAELSKEQRVVVEEIRMYDDSPDEEIADLFARTMWSNSHLGEPTIGYENTVTALRSDDLRGWMRERYAASTVLIAAAGNVDHDAVCAMVKKAFDGYTGSAIAPVPDRPKLTPAFVVKKKDVEQAYVMFGTLGLGMRDDDRYALSVLDSILGGGMSSRLFQEVREKRGLAYSVYSFQQAYREAGIFGVSAGVAPDRIQECIDVIVDQWDQMMMDGVNETELHLAKDYLKGSLTLSLESSASRMMRLGRSEFTFGRQFSTEEIEENIDAVTTEDVARLAHTLLASDQRGLCVLGPLDADRIQFDAKRIEP